MTMSAHEVADLKHAPATEGLIPAVRNRWSARAFAPREVSGETLKKIFEAARWAPSSNNEQPWRYIVGLHGTETHASLVQSLMGFNQAWAPKAPVLVLGLCHKIMSSNGNPNAYAHYDLGAATMLIALQAAELGLTSHQMGGFERDKARTLLGIPEEYDFGALMALGYQDEPAALGNEQLIARELAPRTRKPLSDLVFTAWNHPADFVG